MSERIASQPQTTRPKTPPGPRGHFLLGSMAEVQTDVMGFLQGLAQQYGDVARFRFAWFSGYLVSHPDAIQRVLQENNRNYSKRTFAYQMLKPLVGEGLLTSDGATWLRQRRLIQPAFHRQRIHAFSKLMTGATEQMLERWRAPAFRDAPLNASEEMMRLTLSIVAQALFSQDVSREADVVGRSFTYLNQELSARFRTLFPAPLFLPTPRNRRFKAALAALDGVVAELIHTRRAQLASGEPAPDAPDLLAMLLEARDEDTGEGMTDTQLRDEVMTLLLAGHETTANALTWTWYLLSQNPEAEAKLHAELDRALGGRVPTISDLPDLPYNRMVVQETLRLYPPAWIVSRMAEKDDELCGYAIPAGSVVEVSPYIMQRHPRYWEDPDAFDPERFTPERSQGRPAFAYFPFGGGPRLCIGRDFALVEAQLILATVASRLRLRLEPGFPVEPEALITLRPRNGLQMRLEDRQT